jgi:hypothetical protein
MKSASKILVWKAKAKIALEDLGIHEMMTDLERNVVGRYIWLRIQTMTGSCAQVNESLGGNFFM